MHLPFSIIFCEFCISHISCGHCKIITILQRYCNGISDGFRNISCNFTIFPRNISTIFSKYFRAVWNIKEFSKNVIFDFFLWITSEISREIAREEWVKNWLNKYFPTFAIFDCDSFIWEQKIFFIISKEFLNIFDWVFYFKEFSNILFMIFLFLTNDSLNIPEDCRWNIVLIFK